mmetsp:Transcript_36529/g.58916  ORF Transcript_36529/g.58916 Transcript_36529/m.58916 type:complete len:484 (+) Transcript_36529:387-1838(+)|eukprot:CAMPEP_0203764954 /NCGR_PEP_ID=MMETSP0098-20131031/18143_1 /ASSEMBLY_ACC=CAM_ASM_000208 /TAXON_ID=96639 /ORGANISM=" , Strain NY0313808BC1" /LENGTH=483 /DNA_ID=CAMNT_0050661157 /DNA_START=3795 /DNA_END=5246 /DNA_ORIENTATION=-
MSVSVRREVRSSDARVGRKRLAVIPATSTMEQLPPEPQSSLFDKEPRAASASSLGNSAGCNDKRKTASKQRCKSRVSTMKKGDSTPQTSRSERDEATGEIEEAKSDSTFITAIAADTVEVPKSNNLEERLSKISETQHALRAELEGYVNEMKEKVGQEGLPLIDFGNDFESKVSCEEKHWKSFCLESTKANEALNDDIDLETMQKIDKGKKKIDKLDKKLQEAEARASNVGQETKLLLAKCEDDISKAECHMELENAEKIRGQKKSASKSLLKPPKDGSKDFVARNIQLAVEGPGRVLTASEEARIESILLEDIEDDQDQNLLQLALVPAIDPEELKIDESLKDLVGPDEWETKSAYFAGDDETATWCDTDSCYGPLLSARTASRASLLSDILPRQDLSPMKNVQLKQRNRKRLKEIDSALERVKMDTVKVEESTVLQEEIKYLIEQATNPETGTVVPVADPDKIRTLLQDFLEEPFAGVKES